MHRFVNSLVFRWAAPATWMGVIFFLSSQSNLPRLTSVMPKLQEVGGHFAVYVVLALLWQWTLRGAGLRRAGWWAVLIAVVFGMSDEYHQSFVPGRSMQLSDLAVDTVGASVAVLVSHWAPRLQAMVAPGTWARTRQLK